ncbi:hypothetical protein BDR05DRAFT_854216, partial [Suillus weaverae]
FLLKLMFSSLPGLLKGNHWKLTEFIESHRETLYNDYARLSCAQKNNYEVEIIKMCANKQSMVCDNPKAVQCGMQATFTSMNQELFACALVSKVSMWLSVGGLRTLAEKKSLNNLVSKCWTFIQDELDFIVHKNKLANHVKMNYNNYEKAIVEHHSMELKG